MVIFSKAYHEKKKMVWLEEQQFFMYEIYPDIGHWYMFLSNGIVKIAVINLINLLKNT